jgi:hypothetical protein
MILSLAGIAIICPKLPFSANVPLKRPSITDG